MIVVEFTAIARPAGMGSGRGVPVKRKDGRMGIAVTVSSVHTRPFQAAVAAAAAEHYTGELVREPVIVDLVFCFARPAGHYGSGRNAGRLRDSAPVVPANRSSGDIDKLARATIDALEGTVISDDALVVVLHTVKMFATPERVEVMVATYAPHG
jgi:Holliday junction resolvase RusA-like endonuclease